VYRPRVTDQYPPPPEQPPGDNPQPAYPPPPGYPLPPSYPPPGDPYSMQQYGYPGYPPADPGVNYPGYPPVDPGVNGFAIAALVFGLLSLVLWPLVIFAVIFGIIALVQISKRGQRGRGMAITGLAASAVGVLVLIGVITYAVTQLPDKTAASQTPAPTVAPTVAASTPTPEATEEATTEPTDSDTYVAGDCLNDIKGAGTHVSCTTPHDGEVFGVFTLKNGKWPGSAAVKKQAVAGCDSRLTKYAKSPSKYDYLYAFPVQSAWPDDRRVICVATNPSGKKLTGSIRK